jgi:hypothetical protein
VYHRELQFGPMEHIIWNMELGDMAPEIHASQKSPKRDRLSCDAVLRTLSSFPRKPMNTKDGGIFVLYNLESEFALFGVRTWEI